MAPLTQYLLLFGMLVATSGLVWMLYLIKKSLGSTISEPGKNIPAESGNLAAKPAWLRYHVHYYGYALLFLAFDMEMAYMYPWAVVYKEVGLVALLDMGVFLMILFLGLIYTWTQLGLERQ
ncbi:NADH-quinone oxidoreductase subunit A [Fodinibius sp.]|uniref:NADH-quinone oxidoreductase subunit A n=1 Tax=Fodinibius sp. TaxID=1872440 RepID=UPI002ACECA58|nr:NADH-quinone oxidoreductase subunit A [Fodinibius sp.]MDZ7660513.1 NADH-quinone oxidoreductase subunit A [Fodinibius sp.]